MAQAFVSTYKNHYRWNTQPRVQLVDPDKLTKLKPEGDIWLLDGNKGLENELKNLSKIQEAINNLYLKRMKTTYQVSFCENIKPIKKPVYSLLAELELKKPEKSVKSVKDVCKQETEEGEQDFENELLEYCKKLYEQKTIKIMPPLNSSRTVYGYMRPSRLLTPLTNYQHQYGRVGYNVLKSGYNEVKKHE